MQHIEQTNQSRSRKVAHRVYSLTIAALLIQITLVPKNFEIGSCDAGCVNYTEWYSR